MFSTHSRRKVEAVDQIAVIITFKTFQLLSYPSPSVFESYFNRLSRTEQAHFFDGWYLSRSTRELVLSYSLTTIFFILTGRSSDHCDKDENNVLEAKRGY